jgi:RES domain-containing protein
MIITSLVETVAYRVHQPRWAFDPISGAGAAAEGGRANRKGLHALYLALDPQTALAEYQQRSSLLRPGTLVSYRISVQKIVDFSAGFTKDWPHQ